MKIEIQCLCGEIRIELSGQPISQHYCHCDDCQAAHGAAYVPFAMFPAAEVRVTAGSPAIWSLKTTPRATCAKCGTRIFAEPPGFGIRGVNGFLLPAGSFKPELHLQCRYAVLPVQDLLPHFRSLPARFGGSDDVVDW
jgi:hypothetical protein